MLSKDYKKIMKDYESALPIWLKAVDKISIYKYLKICIELEKD